MNNSIVSSSCTLEQPLLSINEEEELSIVEIRRNDDVDVGETLLNNDEENEDSSSSSSSSSAATATASRLVMLEKSEFGILTIAGLFTIYSQVSSLIVPLVVGRTYDDLVLSITNDNDINDNNKDNKMMRTKIDQLMFRALMIHISGDIASAVRSVCIRITGERIVACESRNFIF